MSALAYLDPRRFRQLLVRSVALPAALMALLAVLLFWEVRQLLKADATADRSDAVLAGAVLVRQLRIDRETGLRGFLLTGNEVFLELEAVSGCWHPWMGWGRPPRGYFTWILPSLMSRFSPPLRTTSPALVWTVQGPEPWMVTEAVWLRPNVTVVFTPLHTVGHV